MKSFIAVSFAAAVAALPAPQVSEATEATTCPSLNGAGVLSNNNQAYSVKCDTWVDSDDVLRITTTELGYKGCLTACDGTVGCGIAQYVATDTEQVNGSCTLFPADAELKTGASSSWTVAVKDVVDEPCETAAPTTSTSAAPAAEPTAFGGIAIRSGSDIQFSSINANGLSFWINKNTTVYTPENTIPAPKDPLTIFQHNNQTATLGLQTTVPGGQLVYIDTSTLGNGELKFTQAHTTSTGTDGVSTGFTVSEGVLQFEGNDFYACPLGAQNGNAYGIYAVSRVLGSNAGASCLGFIFRTQGLGNETEAVWQYA